jgi:hypothetical protein
MGERDGAPHSPRSAGRHDGRRRRRSDGSHSESGAVLILALVYIIAISLIVGALARWATNDLNNTNNFSTTNSLHIAETSAMNTAIESIRYTPWPSGTGGTSGLGETVLPTKAQATGWGWCFQPLTSPVTQPASPGSTVSSVPVGSYTIDVYCNTVERFASSSTRTVTLAACPSTTAAASCEAAPLLSAVVVFDDYPEGGGLLLATQCNVQGVACGEGQAIQSWVWL